MEADLIVLAAGAGVTALGDTAGVPVPIDLVSGVLAHTEPMPQSLERVLNGPLGSIKQNTDGRYVTGLDYAPGADGTDTSAAYGETLIETAARVYPELEGASVQTMTVGHVPIPQDFQPIIGFSARPANLYVASMMSGVTMAPLMGRLAATEILDGTEVSLLSPYRPSRFA